MQEEFCKVAGLYSTTTPKLSATLVAETALHGRFARKFTHYIFIDRSSESRECLLQQTLHLCLQYGIARFGSRTVGLECYVSAAIEHDEVGVVGLFVSHQLFEFRFVVHDWNEIGALIFRHALLDSRSDHGANEARSLLQHCQLIQFEAGGLAEVGSDLFRPRSRRCLRGMGESEYEHRDFAGCSIGKHYWFSSKVFFLQPGKLLCRRVEGHRQENGKRNRKDKDCATKFHSNHYARQLELAPRLRFPFHAEQFTIAPRPEHRNPHQQELYLATISSTSTPAHGHSRTGKNGQHPAAGFLPSEHR